MLEDKKLFRNGTYDNNEHEDRAPGSEQVEIVTNTVKNLNMYWWYNKHKCNYFFSYPLFFC